MVHEIVRPLQRRSIAMKMFRDPLALTITCMLFAVTSVAMLWASATVVPTTDAALALAVGGGNCQQCPTNTACCSAAQNKACAACGCGLGHFGKTTYTGQTTIACSAGIFNCGKLPCAVGTPMPCQTVYSGCTDPACSVNCATDTTCGNTACSGTKCSSS